MVTPADDKQAKTLFVGQTIADYLTYRMHSYAGDLKRWNQDDLLARTPEDIAAELLKRHGVESPTLLDPDSQPDSVDRTVNLDRRYSPLDTRRTVKVYRLSVPFTGHDELFSVQPANYSLNPPAGHVDASRRRLTIEFVHPAGEVPDPEKIGQGFGEVLRRVNWHLDQHRDAAERHNAQIAALGPIQEHIAAIRADWEVLSKIPLPKVGAARD